MFAFPKELRIDIDNPLEVAFQQVPWCHGSFHTCLGGEESQHREDGHGQSLTLSPGCTLHIHCPYISIAYSSRLRNCLLIHSLIHSIVIRVSYRSTIELYLKINGSLSSYYQQVGPYLEIGSLQM